MAAIVVHEGSSVIEAVGGAGGAKGDDNGAPCSCTAGGQGGQGRLRVVATQRTDGQPQSCVPAASLI